MEGDWTPWVMEKEIPSHGEGEQSTKFGGPWPYWPHPPLACKSEREVPLLAALVGVGLVGVGGVGEVGAFATFTASV